MTRIAEQGRDAPDIAPLVRAAAADDRWAWERLVDQYARLTWAITARILADESAQMADPPVLYTEISDQLRLPVGSIGPTSGRCLASLPVLLQAS